MSCRIVRYTMSVTNDLTLGVLANLQAKRSPIRDLEVDRLMFRAPDDLSDHVLVRVHAGPYAVYIGPPRTLSLHKPFSLGRDMYLTVRVEYDGTLPKGFERGQRFSLVTVAQTAAAFVEPEEEPEEEA